MRLLGIWFKVRWVIIALAVGAPALLLIFAIAKTQESGRRSLCQSNLIHLGLALNQYAAANGVYPYAALPNAALPPEKRLSFYFSIRDYLDMDQGRMIHFDMNGSWDCKDNLSPRTVYGGRGGEPLTERREPPYLLFNRCPEIPYRESPDAPCPINYVGVAGFGRDAVTLPSGHPRAGIFGYDRQTHVEDLKDGAACTLTLIETAMANGPWSAGGPSTVRGLDPDRQPYIGRAHQFGGLHRGGVNVAFADGSVRFLKETIDPKVFKALSTIAGGEQLPSGWDR
jgi:prepilin-type processing-associated H-X9-DG protein